MIFQLNGITVKTTETIWKSWCSDQPPCSSFLKHESNLQTKCQMPSSKGGILTAVCPQENDSSTWQKRNSACIGNTSLAYFKGKIETTFLDSRVGFPEGHQCTSGYGPLCLPTSSSWACPSHVSHKPLWHHSKARQHSCTTARENIPLLPKG